MKNSETKMVDLGKYCRQLANRFTLQNIQNPTLDARLLIEAVTGFDYAGIILNDKKQLTGSELGKIEQFAARRLAGEPVSKILSRKEFYGRTFFVNASVLDPRPDTETLIDVVLKLFADRSEPIRILDLGSGSGAIIVTLLCEFANAIGVASDISEEALAVTKNNSERWGVAERLSFNHGSWCEGLDGVFDLIVSNPPYIKSNVIETLGKEVRNYDPLIALDGGGDGLKAYRMLSKQCYDYLSQNGVICLEIGFDQGVGVVDLFEACGFQKHATVEKVTRDLAGNNRVVTLAKP